MADPRRSAPDAVRGGLWDAIRRRSAAARAEGALQPIETDVLAAPDGGIPFGVRIARAQRRKPRSSGGEASNPFLPPDPELVVGPIGESHLCVLNKYPVIEHHALVVTREFEDQEAPLTRRDFEAIWTCLQAGGGFGFYNSGRVAGASQPHRHLQLVPTPLVGPPLATPLDAVLGEAHFDGGVGRLPALPFLHGLARLGAIEDALPADAAPVLFDLYRGLARAFGCHRHGQPYNLLLARDWMLLVPRSHAKWRGVDVNALGFAGLFFVKGEDELAIVRGEGPLRLLARVAVPLATG